MSWEHNLFSLSLLCFTVAICNLESAIFLEPNIFLSLAPRLNFDSWEKRDIFPLVKYAVTMAWVKLNACPLIICNNKVLFHFESDIIRWYHVAVCTWSFDSSSEFLGNFRHCFTHIAIWLSFYNCFNSLSCFSRSSRYVLVSYDLLQYICLSYHWPLIFPLED